MYLKRRFVNHERHYILCESYWDVDCWRSRQLMDLGPDPEQHVVYPGGNSFYVDQVLEERLQAKGSPVDSDALEALFMPFIDPRIRRIVEMFQRPKNRSGRHSRLNRDELMAAQQRLHPFDKRRLHYLRCGRVDIGNLDARPWKFLNILLDKSRDELEHLLEEMERDLPPHEMGDYIYTALHMQRHFSHLLTRHHPAFLGSEKLDAYLLEDLCQLNRDPEFFMGVGRYDPDTLHPYLTKYLILYFDNPFDPQNIWQETVEDFIRKHRFHSPPRSRAPEFMPEVEACRCLGILPEDFKKMDRKALRRCYRRRAKESHPDQGGDEGTFIQITQAYERLRTLKS
ncbi:MAG: J domain-containing protein [Deltaproteobacteria bacterium]|nr:J domain-containing protein [Deltaproteobacteria bacterium]